MIYFAELFWKIFPMDISDEQIAINHCLKRLNVTWTSHTRVNDICSIKSGWKSNDAPLSVYVLPQRHFCRICCNRQTNSLYNVHPTTKKEKIKRHEYMKSWFLKESWENLINSTAKGDEWLQNISTIELETWSIH